MKTWATLFFLHYTFIGAVASQDDSRYYRGWQINLSFGVEGFNQGPIAPYVLPQDTTMGPRTTTGGRLSVPSHFTDSIYYYIEPTRSITKKAKDGSLIYNAQLQFNRKLLNGLAYSLGLTFSKGRFISKVRESDLPFSDLAYPVREEEFTKFGLTGSLGFVIFRRKKIQPFIHAQGLITNYHYRIFNEGILFTRDNHVRHFESLGLDESTIELKFRLLVGFTYYPISKFGIGAEMNTMPGGVNRYVGLSTRYKLTTY